MKLHLAGQDFNVSEFTVTLSAESMMQLDHERYRLVAAVHDTKRFYCQSFAPITRDMTCEVHFREGRAVHQFGPKTVKR